MFEKNSVTIFDNMTAFQVEWFETLLFSAVILVFAAALVALASKK